MNSGLAYKKRLKAHACRNITYLLDKLGVDYSQTGDLIQAACPAKQHGGDGNNRTAFSWKMDYEHWRCWTHHCDDLHGGDVFGLVRSVLECTFPEAQTWVENTLKQMNVDVSEKVEARAKPNPGKVHIHQPLEETRIGFLKPDKPPQLLLDRGFDPAVLKDYQVGKWHRLGNFMHNRIVIPVRDHDGRLVGFTGRTVLPDEQITHDHPKWVHGRYFDRFAGELKTSSILFNLHRAKDHLRMHRVLMCEGPFDGFAFQMADVLNWVCTLGTSFQPQHRTLLIQYGVNEIITAYDPDPAGQAAHRRVCDIVGDLIRVTPMGGLEGDPGSYAKRPDELRKLYHATIERD